MGNNQFTRVNLADQIVVPQHVHVTDRGDGQVSIYLGSMEIDTTIDGWHRLSEAVWSGIFRSAEESRYNLLAQPLFHRDVIL